MHTGGVTPHLSCIILHLSISRILIEDIWTVFATEEKFQSKDGQR